MSWHYKWARARIWAKVNLGGQAQVFWYVLKLYFLLAAFAVGAAWDSTTEKLFRDNPSMLAGISIFACLGLFGFIAIQIGSMNARLGRSIEYIDCRDFGRKAIYRKAMSWVRAARYHIHIVHSYLPEYPSDDDDDVGAATAYYEAIVAQAASGVEYKRLFQLSEDVLKGRTREDALNMCVISDPMRAHISKLHLWNDEIADKSASTSANVHIKTVEASRTSTFVLIDNTRLIWQINERCDPTRVANEHNRVADQRRRTPEKSPGGLPAVRIHGAFLIHDPSGEIIEHFRRTFNLLDGKAIPIVKNPFAERWYQFAGSDG